MSKIVIWEVGCFEKSNLVRASINNEEDVVLNMTIIPDPEEGGGQV